ncbi:Dystroglycan [Armadillidium nasatum]|uniref:Dystroglycan 1 n=1 Tax=Armadillidium nasatum TaxID=96803 RepID=A0A5N5TNQ2_9CRUS|nr:Dystroglycan [Armadillidium nasatum]
MMSAITPFFCFWLQFIMFFDLPSWLSYSEQRNVIEGVPGHTDIGTHYITIQAQGTDGSGARDACAIQVTDIPASSLLKESRCTPKQDLSLLSIILEKSWSSLSPRERVHLIQTVSNMFMVKPKRISLVPSSTYIDPLSDDSAIMAGPGKFRPGHYSLPPESPQGQIKIQWHVGCDGQVHKEEKDILANVEQALKIGKLEDASNIMAVGWVVTQVNPITKRVKRETEFSGDYEENDYEYNYDEDYFHLNNILDRPVPSLATPVFPDSVASEYSEEVPSSPVFKPVPLATPVLIPVKPTRIAVEPSPTVTIDRTEYPMGKETHLESSLLTHPTTSADYTTPLTSTSTIRTEPTRESSPIEATSVPDVSETTEYAVKNFPPRVNNRIQKLPWIAGNVYRMQIPEDTFMDVEDGGTRNLTLVLKDENGFSFPRESWIQFDPTNQEVYALPLEKHIGRYDFRLEAIDKDRKSVIDYLEINVWQHSQARTFNHQFTAVLKMEKKYEYDFAFSLDWQVKAVEKIAALFSDSVSNVNIRNITNNPVQISWTNVSLIDSQSTVCPTEELEAITKVMLTGHGSEPTRTAKLVFMPEFQLKEIRTQFYDLCETHFHHGRQHSHTDGSKHPFSPLEGESGREEVQENTPPIIRNQIDQRQANVGEFFREQVQDDFCYDAEDGNSRNLQMRLLTIDLAAPSRDSWLQFDAANQEFYGLPLKGDVKRQEYILECMDSKGRYVSDAFIFVVHDDESPAPRPVLFSITIDASYDDFMMNPYDKARFMERLGRAFGDKGAEYVKVKDLRKGSVKVDWYNKSLPNFPCPLEEVQRLREIMTDDNGQLLQSFKDAFLPDFVISDTDTVIPSGSCLAPDTPTHVEEEPLPPPDEEGVTPPQEEDYLLTFVIPAVIIAAMLLLAALVACCLYRRRRYGKMSMAGDRTFVSKGIPIIFAEELDDNRTDSAKSPVIMKEEKPPLPPPEYQRNSPPRTDRQRPPSGDMNSSEDAPYHRPPPFHRIQWRIEESTS